MAKAKGRNAEDGEDQPGLDRIRLDRWLWHARFARTRGKAQILAESGHVRVNGEKVRDCARFIRVGDMLTLALDHRTVVVRVLALAEKRSAFDLARLTYEEIA